MDNKDLEKDTALVTVEAEVIVIENDEQNLYASEFLKKIKGVMKRIGETFDPIVTKAHSAHKEAIAQKNKHTAPLKKAEVILKTKIGYYMQEQERLRAEEQRRLEKEAREAAEALALAEASTAETEEEQEEIIQTAIDDTPVVFVPEKPKIAGISIRKTWDYKIIDVSKINSKFMIPDAKKIKKMVDATGKDAEAIVGGIKLFEGAPIIGARSS